MCVCVCVCVLSLFLSPSSMRHQSRVFLQTHSWPWSIRSMALVASAQNKACCENGEENGVDNAVDFACIHHFPAQYPIFFLATLLSYT